MASSAHGHYDGIVLHGGFAVYPWLNIIHDDHDNDEDANNNDDGDCDDDSMRWFAM